MSSTGELIRNARRKKELSQEELARAIGSTKSAISRYESGKRQPEFDQIRRIANALDVTVSYLLGWDIAEDRLRKAGLSVDDLAEELGLTRQTLFEILDSDSPEATPKIIRAATLLAADVEQQRNAIVKRIKDRLAGLQTPVDRIYAAVRQMDVDGQNKVADYAEDILPRYRAETVPQAPPQSSEGTDTTQDLTGSDEAQSPPDE